MASPQKHGGKKKVTWQWAKKAKPQYPTNQYARYRGATPTPVKDMRIPVLGGSSSWDKRRKNQSWYRVNKWVGWLHLEVEAAMRMTEGVAAAAAVHHVAKHFGIDGMDAAASAAESTAEPTTRETTAEAAAGETTTTTRETAAAIHALPEFIVVIISSTFPENRISSVSNEWC